MNDKNKKKSALYLYDIYTIYFKVDISIENTNITNERYALEKEFPFFIVKNDYADILIINTIINGSSCTLKSLHLVRISIIDLLYLLLF